MARENNEPAKYLVQTFMFTEEPTGFNYALEAFLNQFTHPFEMTQTTSVPGGMVIVLRVSNADYENYNNVGNQDALNNNS